MMNRLLLTHLKALAILMACFVCSPATQAANWVKLNDSAHSRLLLDKQSIVTQAALKKAWVKVEYKTPQKNPDSVDKVYNLSKALWHFDCAQQTSATTQVFQYLNQELVYSASVDMKGAEFIEPMPDSDLQIAMQYVCKSYQATPSTKPATQNVVPSKASPAPATPEVTPAKSATEAPQEKPTKTAPPAPATADNPPPPEKAEPIAAQEVPVNESTASKLSKPTKSKAWGYQGKTGPEQWGKLSSEYAACASGLNQSPVAFESTIHSALKPIRVIHKFAAKEMLSTPNGLRVLFKEGNMMVLDKTAFQLKHLDFHTPSEHQLNGQSYPLEIQLWHEDSKKNIAIMSILFKTGEPNAELTELLAQLPQKTGESIKLKTRYTPNELMPTNPQYYRYSGSLTSPPCNEGVRWIVMKSPLQVSAEQVQAITTAIGGPNSRPIQPLHGRSVLE
jgi:carbonic anhydrase